MRESCGAGVDGKRLPALVWVWVNRQEAMKPAGLGMVEEEGWNGINKLKHRAAAGRDAMCLERRCEIDRMG